MALLIKNLNGLAYASIKSRNGLAVASIKNINGLDATSGATPAITYTDTATDATDTSTYTFTSRAIGTAASDRYVIVGVYSRQSADTTLTVSGMTIAGITASLVTGTAITGVNGAASTTTSLWIAAVPTGTTATVVVTTNVAAQRCAIAVWQATGITGTPSDATTYFQGNSATTISLDSDVTSTSVVAAIGGFVGISSVAWTGATENVDAGIEASRYTAATYTSAGAETPRTFTATLSGDNRTGSLAVFN